MGVFHNRTNKTSLSKKETTMASLVSAFNDCMVRSDGQRGVSRADVAQIEDGRSTRELERIFVRIGLR